MVGIGRYKHVFFDLDHTLWDFERNSKDTLSQLLLDYREQMKREMVIDDFFPTYWEINQNLWKEYREDRIDVKTLRQTRFRAAFEALSIDHSQWVEDFEAGYMSLCPNQPHLIPGALELLNYLQGKVHLHIITNGFPDTQGTKLNSSGIGDYFRTVVTSASIGVKKPNPAIFHFALDRAKASTSNSIYVGDSYEADVKGSLNAGIDVIYYNPEQNENPLKVPEVSHLSQLRSLLQKPQ